MYATRNLLPYARAAARRSLPPLSSALTGGAGLVPTARHQPGSVAREASTLSPTSDLEGQKQWPGPAQARAKSAVAAEAEYGSFCFQCEQTENGTGCTVTGNPGVCGKTPEVASLQDLFIHQLQGISQYAHRARELGAMDRYVDGFVLDGMFSTLTNVNFDPQAFERFLAEGEGVRDRARAMYEEACAKAGKQPEQLGGPAQLQVGGLSRGELERMGRSVGVLARKDAIGNDDLHGLGEMVLYGLKGTMAYADHARVLGSEAEEVYAFVHRAMDALTRTAETPLGDMLALALAVGETNLKVMELLDAGHTGRYGHPTPTEVLTSAVAGKCLLVSGHDIRDLEEVLERTKGKGINVYTHGELLPAHGYPALKEKYPHLTGNYGGPWQLQKMEFSRFPGPILLTSNCLVEPQKRYRDRIYTRRFVGWEGIPNLQSWDEIDQVVEHALRLPGFTKDETRTTTTVGFGHNAVLGLADTVVNAVKTGDIKRFVLIGGCDGAEGERSYFRDLALGLPNDAVVLTLGCGKYRFNKATFETTAGGIPRMLDIGQCNDAYGAIQIASALANAFETDVNGLPLSFAVSWFEQKAVAVLLTLLHLGIKNIYLGPELPAFATPNMLQILVDNYGIRAINAESYEKDLAQMLKGE